MTISLASELAVLSSFREVVPTTGRTHRETAPQFVFYFSANWVLFLQSQFFGPTRKGVTNRADGVLGSPRPVRDVSEVL